jgi:hypothetical protein
MRAGAACPHNTVLEARFRYSTRTSRELTFHFIFLGSISSVCATASRARARPEGPSGFAWHVCTAKATLCDCGTGECRFSTPSCRAPALWQQATRCPLNPSRLAILTRNGSCGEDSVTGICHRTGKQHHYGETSRPDMVSEQPAEPDPVTAKPITKETVVDGSA